ncbi:hypothetical protein [uncultured Roseibium sp.]|uniref:hypothetical protein n=1 Tax=uncultured Roseibium sp. TaxID=1936171 RepID=UPI00262BDE84|nr:hypothetical protein [uncultured Roseibium sp.]
MPDPIPFERPAPTRSASKAASASRLHSFFNWCIFSLRRQQSLRAIPDELLDDVISDEDTRTGERMRRTSFQPITWMED